MTRGRQLFLIDNLSQIHQFFSVYDPSRDPLVIAADRMENRAFFNDFLGAKMAVLPERGLWLSGPDMPPLPVWRDWLGEMIALMPSLHAFARSLPADAELFWWHFMGQLPLYTMLGRLRDRGIATRFIDSRILSGLCEWNHQTADDLDGAHPAYEEFLQTASRVTGVTLGITRVRPRGQENYHLRAIGPVRGDYGPERTIDLKPWAQIKPLVAGRIERLLPPRPPGGPTRILLVDDMLRDQDGFAMGTTGPRIHAFFRRCLAEGKEIYVKPHYHSADHISITDPALLSQVRRLPHMIPVELFLDEFDEICFYFSSGAAQPVPGRRLCLLDLLDFTSPTMEAVCRDLVRTFYPADPGPGGMCSGSDVVFIRREDVSASP